MPVDGQKVKVESDEVILSEDSDYRFVTIKAALLNDTILKDYIETILNAPNLSRPETKPSKE